MFKTELMATELILHINLNKSLKRDNIYKMYLCMLEKQ